MENPYISIVFATKNRIVPLRKTISSIRAELKGVFSYEIVIIDGNSTDGTIEYLQNQDDVRLLIEDKPRGCCFAFDQVFRAARGEWVSWLNDDVEIRPGSYKLMLDFLNRKENASIGMGAFTSSRSRNEPHSFILNIIFDCWLPYANFGILRRSLLEQLEYIDLDYHKYAWDEDLALKVWDVGFIVAPCPGAHIIHYFEDDEMRKSDESSRTEASRHFVKKWMLHPDSVLAKKDLQLSYYECIWEELDERFQWVILACKGQPEKAELMAFHLVNETVVGLKHYYMLGVILENLGYLDIAERVYKYVITLGGNDKRISSLVNCRYGELISKNSEDQDVNSGFYKALELNSDNGKAKILLLSHDDKLDVLCSPDKIVYNCTIWIDINPANDKWWQYYFNKRKIDSFELRSNLKYIGWPVSFFVDNLCRYLKPNGEVKLYFSDYKDITFTVKNELESLFNKAGFEIMYDNHKSLAMSFANKNYDRSGIIDVDKYTK